MTPSSAPRRRAFRIATAIAATALVAAGVSACSSDSTASGDTAAISSAAKPAGGCPAAASITIWALQNSQAQADLDTKMANTYESVCPGAKITYQYYTGSAMNEKITTVMASGTPPTIIQPTDPSTMEQYAKTGQIADLSKELTAVSSDWTSKFEPAALTPSTFSGQTYGFPYFGAAPTLLWYNKSVFTKAGIAKPPTTLAQLTTDITKLKAKNIIPIALGDQDKYPSAYWAQYLVEREGGSTPFADVVAGKADAWSDPAVSAGLTQLQTLSKEGAFGTGFDSTGDANGADRALLYTGRAAMMLSGTTFLSKVEASDPDLVKSNGLGYVAFPSGKQTVDTVDGGASSNWFVPSKSSAAQKKLAYSYMATELTSKAFAAGQAKIGIIPAIAGAADLAPDTVQGRLVKFAYSLAATGPLENSWTVGLGNDDTVLTDDTAAVISRTMTPAQFVQAMNKALGD